MNRIYSIGYEHLEPTELDAISTRIGAVVIDVRARMSRVKSGYGRRQLEALLGDRYQWRGDVLGGFGADTTDGREWLYGFDRPTILLCKEFWPGDCHRHQTIAAPMLHAPLAGAKPVDCLHIFEGVVIPASELGPDGEPLNDDACCSIEEHIKQLRKS